MLERPLLAVGVHANRHRGARAQAREKIVVRVRTGVGTYPHRLVSNELMATCGDGLREAVSGHFGHPHMSVCKRRVVGDVRLGRRCQRIPTRPLSDDPGNVRRVILVSEQVVRAIDRNERLRVPRRLENDARVVDRDRVIHGGMHDEKRGPEIGDPLGLRLHLKIAQKLQLDAERPAAQIQLGLSVALDGGEVVAEQMHDMLRVGRCSDRDHCGRLRDLTCRSQHGRSAE